MGKRRWTDQQLTDAVRTSKTKADVIKKLGLKPHGSYRIISNAIERLRLDISHFLNREEINYFARLQKTCLTAQELFAENTPYSYAKNIKNIILRDGLLHYKCDVCGLNDWNNKEIVLQLDHINGIHTDNRLKNLRLLCPNCHSQTNTYCGRKLKIRKSNKCDICNIPISRQARLCKSCKSKQQPTKIKWPSVELLKQLVEKLGYCGTGKKLGVSDNAIRKRLKKYGSVA